MENAPSFVSYACPGLKATDTAIYSIRFLK